jgi:hypothetical protein
MASFEMQRVQRGVMKRQGGWPGAKDGPFLRHAASHLDACPPEQSNPINVPSQTHRTEIFHIFMKFVYLDLGIVSSFDIQI